mmetsp:Transcript_19896/g.25115  ORF Transcript_19896/g.25115 Transcript_19896/m.25115 type:complete len:114 (+) Transcript_19896:57-398(+)
MDGKDNVPAALLLDELADSYCGWYTVFSEKSMMNVLKELKEDSVTGTSITDGTGEAGLGNPMTLYSPTSLIIPQYLPDTSNVTPRQVHLPFPKLAKQNSSVSSFAELSSDKQT